MITDRTDPQTDWNETDQTRIENKINELNLLLVQYGYGEKFAVEYTWNVNEFPSYEKIKTLSDRVQALKESFYTLSSTPSTPDLDFLTVQKANDIEKILVDIEFLIQGMLNAMPTLAFTLGGDDFD